MSYRDKTKKKHKETKKQNKTVNKQNDLGAVNGHYKGKKCEINSSEKMSA
jgi:hypothetical protein